MKHQTRMLLGLLTLLPLVAGCMVPPHFDPAGYSGTYRNALIQSQPTLIVSPESLESLPESGYPVEAVPPNTQGVE